MVSISLGNYTPMLLLPVDQRKQVHNTIASSAYKKFILYDIPELPLYTIRLTSTDSYSIQHIYFLWYEKLLILRKLNYSTPCLTSYSHHTYSFI